MITGCKIFFIDYNNQLWSRMWDGTLTAVLAILFIIVTRCDTSNNVCWVKKILEKNEWRHTLLYLCNRQKQWLLLKLIENGQEHVGIATICWMTNFTVPDLFILVNKIEAHRSMCLSSGYLCTVCAQPSLTFFRKSFLSPFHN